jgi:peptidoglycan/LPS O-acetylase OafA/YrhL
MNAIDKLRQQNSDRFLYLDSIRGIASLSVVLCHYVAVYGKPGSSLFNNVIIQTMFDGKSAVALFFVLSGFLLSFKYMSNDQLSINYHAFIVSRFTRIWIPFAVVLLLSAVTQTLYTPVNHTEWAVKLWSIEHDANGIIRQLIFKHDSTVGRLMPQDWTLRIELLLSLTIPALVLIVRRSTTWMIGCTLYAFAVFHVSYFIIHFAIGVMIAKHHKYIAQILENAKNSRHLLLAVGFLLYASRNLNTGLDSQTLYVITGIGSAILVIVVFSDKGMQSALNHKALRYVGQISYSVYLLHMLVTMAITPVFMGLVGNNWLIGLFISVALTIALSAILFEFVEKPCISMGRKYTAFSSKINLLTAAHRHQRHS